MHQDLSVFVFSSTLMALGIGIDAAMATLVRARAFQTRAQARYWILGVSLTHTVFPLVGYVLAYICVQYLPWLTPLVGVVAFLLVSQFLYGELNEKNSESQPHNPWISLGLILAVSWDALWSGPAKSAQVLGWSDWMIWLSFLWVGLFVCLLCIASDYIGRCFFEVFKSNQLGIKFALWLQYSVIGYFGLLALLRYSFNWQVHEVIIFMMSASFIYVYQLFQGNYKTQ